MNDTIRGALVEVHFELQHFFIPLDSYELFNTTIEQILILQPGEAPPETPYKRKKVRDGPIRLNPTPVQQQHFQHSSVTASSIILPSPNIPHWTTTMVGRMMMMMTAMTLVVGIIFLSWCGYLPFVHSKWHFFFNHAERP